MRRCLLLVLGFSGSLVVTAILWMSVRGHFVLVRMELPVPVAQTALTVLELRSYDGPFLEDGSRRQVQGVAALVLHNRGEQLLKNGAVKLWVGGELLVFSFTMLPPGGRILVLENSAKAYSCAAVTDCWGWSVACDEDTRLRVEEAGRTSLALVNTGNEVLERACVYFKDYDPEQRLLIGGITHCVQVTGLQPGRRIVLPVFRYISGNSMVVQ